MGELEFTTPRRAWGGEAAAFTPALAGRLSYLGEVCGLGPLELTGTEVPVGARRIDVLASAEQRSVVIENQYGVADHEHLTRGLAYAVAKQAAALVVVAERHTDEFVAVADYLNGLVFEASDAVETVSVWLVEVEAVRRKSDDIWSPLFTVRTRPNRWLRRDGRSRGGHQVRDISEVIERSMDPAIAQALVDAWQTEPHTTIAIGGDVNPTIQLRHPDPVDPNHGHALITVLPRRVWVNANYILDTSGAFENPDHRQTFERLLRDAVPDAASRHGELPAYLAIDYAELRQQQTAFEHFVEWLLKHMDEQVTAAGEITG
jgi:hypothetical protein